MKRIEDYGEDEKTDTTLVHEAIKGNVKLDLHTAISHAPEALNKLDENGLAPIHLKLSGSTEDWATIDLLLENGADVNLKCALGWTLLHYAARGYSQGLTEQLASVGADVDLKNSDGWTPLMMAIYSGDLSSVKALLAAGANPQCSSNQGETALHFLPQCSIHSRIGSVPRFTSHHDALLGDTNKWNKCRWLVLALARAGADIETRCKSGLTPLLTAVVSDNYSGYHDLLTLGARLDVTSRFAKKILRCGAHKGVKRFRAVLRKIVLETSDWNVLEGIDGYMALGDYMRHLEGIELVEEARAPYMVRQTEPPPLDLGGVRCFQHQGVEIREYYDPERRRHRRDYPEVAKVANMPGGWATDAEDSNDEDGLGSSDEDEFDSSDEDEVGSSDEQEIGSSDEEVDSSDEEEANSEEGNMNEVWGSASETST